MFSRRKEVNMSLYDITKRVGSENMLFIKAEGGALNEYDNLKCVSAFGLHDIKYILDGRYVTSEELFDVVVLELQKILDAGVSNLKLVCKLNSTIESSSHIPDVHSGVSDTKLELKVTKIYTTENKSLHHGIIKLSAITLFDERTFEETLKIQIARDESLSFVFSSSYMKKFKGGF